MGTVVLLVLGLLVGLLVETEKIVCGGLRVGSEGRRLWIGLLVGRGVVASQPDLQ